MKNKFRLLAAKISTLAGSAFVFIGAIFIIMLWAITGPLFNFSDTWQLIINTGTTIVTFLMVFLIQNTQNRDAKAMHLKLDELIRSNKLARDSFVSLEDISDEELAELTREFRALYDNLPETRAIAKMHKKLEAERAKRQTLRQMSQRVAGAIFNPLVSTIPHNKQDNKL